MKVTRVASLVLTFALLTPNVEISADAVTSFEKQVGASWQLSSLDQPILGGAAIDNIYQYPTSAGQGVKIYIACESQSDHSAINGVTGGVAKNTQIEILGSCGGDREADLALQISQALSSPSISRKVLVVEGAGSALSSPNVKAQLANAESAGVVVIANSISKGNLSSCENNFSINVMGYGFTQENRRVRIYGGARPRSEWTTCADLAAPLPDPLGYTAGVVANFLGLNPLATPSKTRNEIINNAEPENFAFCQRCGFRTLSQSFLFPERPSQAQVISTDIVNQNGSPIMNYTQYAVRDAVWNKVSQKYGEANWFGCDRDLGCRLLASGMRLPSVEASMGSGEQAAVITRSEVAGIVYTLLSYSKNEEIADRLAGIPRVGHSIWGGSSYPELLWYSCQRSYDLLQARLPSDCNPKVGESPNSTRLNPTDVGRYVLGRPKGDIAFFTRTVGPIGKSQPEVSISNVPETHVGGSATFRFSVDPDENSCPKKIYLSISERRPVSHKKLEVKLVNCRGKQVLKIRSNTNVTASVKESLSSEAASAKASIFGTPSLFASAPKRAYDYYQLKVRTMPVRSVRCTVDEEYFTFSGDRLSSSSFSIGLQNGSKTVTRKTKFVGVIMGTVTCPSGLEYGESYAAFKVFSY